MVHCRTGSLEKPSFLDEALNDVHCRTGSLETACQPFRLRTYRSLPYRQLRNWHT